LVKDKVFSIIAHDLRSPLRSLINLMEMFGKDYITHNQLKEQLPKLSSQLVDTTNMTENLLTWAKAQLKGINAIPESFSLEHPLRDSVNVYHAKIGEKGLKIDWHGMEKETQVYADLEMTKTIFRNILHNAIKFSPTGGKISIKTESNGSYTRIAFTDEGSGIEEELIENILQKGEIRSKSGTSGEEGTGLGLLITKELVDLNKGKLYIESQKDRGSTFTVELPIHT